MEPWVNWAVFIPLVAGLTVYYYWPRAAQAPTKAQPVPAINSAAKPEKSTPPKQKKAALSKTSSLKAAPSKEKSTGNAVGGVAKEGADRKVESNVATSEETADDSLREAKEFAKRMTQARQGVEVKSNEIKGGRVKTVKQSSVISADSGRSAPAHTESADDNEVANSSASTRDAGSVADMLEPATPAPMTLRITPSEKPVRANGHAKPPKDGKTETQSKKARQNEKKKEEQRLQREEDEKIRKALEEKQRRTAREARGEPAKNGIPVVAKPPATNSWTANTNSSISADRASNTNIALLDTFETESIGQNGISATATKTTDSHQAAPAPRGASQINERANVSEEQDDDAAWTTAGSKRKQKKTQTTADKASDAHVVPKPISTVVAPATKPSINGKPIGFQALTDEYEQRTDVDASDASNWDA
jgi:hypothetical protein